MPKFPCPVEGCGFRGKTERALITHLGWYKKAKTELSLIGEEVEQHEADQRQVKRHRISSIEPLEVVPEAEEPMDVDLEVSGMSNWSKIRHLTLLLSDQDDNQPGPGSSPLPDIPPTAGTQLPSTSRYGCVHRLPSRYQDVEINSREIGPSLSHIPAFRTLRQQQEEAEAERRRNHPSPIPPHSPTPPAELETFRTEEDEFG